MRQKSRRRRRRRNRGEGRKRGGEKHSPSGSLSPWVSSKVIWWVHQEKKHSEWTGSGRKQSTSLYLVFAAGALHYLPLVGMNTTRLSQEFRRTDPNGVVYNGQLSAAQMCRCSHSLRMFPGSTESFRLILEKTGLSQVSA